MGSLGDPDAETKPARRNRNADYAFVETEPYDSLSSPSSSGEKVIHEDADEVLDLPSTTPYDDILLAEDAFETQVVNLGGETQALDSDAQTQLVDDQDGVLNIGTQLLDDFNNDISIDGDGDGDGEGMDETEILDDGMETSDGQSMRRHGGQSLEAKKIGDISLCKNDNNGSPKQTDGLNDKRCTPGSAIRFTSVRTASLRAAGLAARNRTSKGTENGLVSICTTSQPSEEFTEKTNMVIPNSWGEVDLVHDKERYNENLDGLGNEIDCWIGRPTVRRLFTDDSLTQNEGFPQSICKLNGGEDLSQTPFCHRPDGELAGLSYIDSQEPGELSQANALDVVDRLIVGNSDLFDHQDDHAKSSRGRSKLLSGSKGSSSLAKKVNNRSTIGESGIFEWDDTHEDEGGGDIFCRRKEEFFGNGSHGRRSYTQPQKPKASRLEKFNDNEEQRNPHSKKMICSDSRLVSNNFKVNEKTEKEAEMKFRRNLVDEFDKQFNVDLSRGQLEATGSRMVVPELLNVGFDTQMAAEAMEALCNIESIEKHEDAQGNHKVIWKSSSRRKTRSGGCLREPASQKHLSEVGIATRQSKRRKQKFSVSTGKRSKNSHKEYDANQVIMKSKRARSNPSDQFTVKGSEKVGKMLVEISEQRNVDEALEKSTHDAYNRSHVSATLSGVSSEKKQMQDQVVVSTPIARRTRQSMAASWSKGGQPSHGAGKTKSGKLERNGAGHADFEARELLSADGNQSGNLENVKLNRHDTKLRRLDDDIAAVSYPRGRRSHRNLSAHVNGSDDLDAQPRPPINLKDVEQPVSVLKTQKTATGNALGLTIKRRTRSSTNVPSILPYVDKSVNGEFLQQSSDEPGSLDVPSMVNYSDKKNNSDVSLSAQKEADVRSDKSPEEKLKLSSSASGTLVNCMTPVNDASPVCRGDGYFKQSCRKDLSRGGLIKEIRSLTATTPESPPPFPSPLKELRKRRDLADVRVLFSHHLDEDVIKQQKKILARLGVPIASSISDATHFITDEFVRTRNMLEAIASGKPVVTHLWLQSIGQVKCRIDEEKYILRDIKKEKEFGFSMPVTLARARQHPLLQGRRVLLTPNTKPSKEIVSSLVKAVHGQVLERICRSVLKDDKMTDDLLVLSCEEDYEICVPFLEKGAAVYSSELILNGIVTQRLEHERYRLFTEKVKMTRSTVRLRKDGDKFLSVSRH